MQAIAEQFQQTIRAASAARTPLIIRGGGSKDWYGNAGPAARASTGLDGAAALLDARAYTGVVAYEPTELVITARCGTPLDEIEALLARHGQMLAFEPPRFGPASTIGGVVASALSGPRRASAGAVRDFMLGARLIDGSGEHLRFGGQVMKNVAGYDVARLLAGSLGTLGLITEVSIKVLPLPLREASLRFELGEIEALARLNEWAGQPLPISASCWHDGVLSLRLSGAEAAVTAAQRKLGGAALDGAAFWTSLRDQTHAYFSGGDLWRLSVPPAASAIILKGEQLIEWGGAQRWFKAAAADAQKIRSTTAAAGGHATLFRRAAAPSAGVPASVFHPLAPALQKIHQRLRAQFDPSGIFNPGRMD